MTFRQNWPAAEDFRVNALACYFILRLTFFYICQQFIVQNNDFRMADRPKQGRGTNWKDDEIKQLIAIWREPETQDKINSKKSAKKLVWEEIAVIIVVINCCCLSISTSNCRWNSNRNSSLNAFISIFMARKYEEMCAKFVWPVCLQN